MWYPRRRMLEGEWNHGRPPDISSKGRSPIPDDGRFLQNSPSHRREEGMKVDLDEVSNTACLCSCRCDLRLL